MPNFLRTFFNWIKDKFNKFLSFFTGKENTGDKSESFSSKPEDTPIVHQSQYNLLNHQESNQSPTQEVFNIYTNTNTNTEGKKADEINIDIDIKEKRGFLDNIRNKQNESKGKGYILVDPAGSAFENSGNGALSGRGASGELYNMSSNRPIMIDEHSYIIQGQNFVKNQIITTMHACDACINNNMKHDFNKKLGASFQANLLVIHSIGPTQHRNFLQNLTETIKNTVILALDCDNFDFQKNNMINVEIPLISTGINVNNNKALKGLVFDDEQKLSTSYMEAFANGILQGIDEFKKYRNRVNDIATTKNYSFNICPYKTNLDVQSFKDIFLKKMRTEYKHLNQHNNYKDSTYSYESDRSKSTPRNSAKNTDTNSDSDNEQGLDSNTSVKSKKKLKHNKYADHNSDDEYSSHSHKQPKNKKNRDSGNVKVSNTITNPRNNDVNQGKKRESNSRK